MEPKKLMVRVALGLIGGAVGSVVALQVAAAATLVGGILEGLLGVVLVSWEMAGLITPLMAALVGAAAGLLAVTPRSPLVGVSLGLVLHGLAFGWVACAEARPLTVNVWFFAVGLLTGCTAGMAGAATRIVGDRLLAKRAR